MKPLNSIEDILVDIAAGRMVVIMDDEDVLDGVQRLHCAEDSRST